MNSSAGFVDIKMLYNRWLGAKERYEMAKVMNTGADHKNNFKKVFIALSKELHQALEAQGITTRSQIEKALNDLSPKKPTLTLIRGGKQ